MEFIDFDSYMTAPKGEKLFHLHFDYFVSEKNNPDAAHWEITPCPSYGLTDHILFDTHSSIFLWTSFSLYGNLCNEYSASVSLGSEKTPEALGSHISIYSTW